jgi:8-amino-7-oxononanoate synthase
VAPCIGARGLTFSTGYLANLAILSSLAGRNDAIFADRLNHACLNDGVLLARAGFIRYPHGDMATLERLLVRRRQAQGDRHRRRVQHGRRPGASAAAARTRRRARRMAGRRRCAWLRVIGQGRGSAAHFGLVSDRIIYMGTLGKAAGVAGAFVARTRR